MDDNEDDNASDCQQEPYSNVTNTPDRSGERNPKGHIAQATERAWVKKDVP